MLIAVLLIRIEYLFHRFYTHAEAVDCMRLVSGTKLDERIIRCDLDPGYKEGRQYGRGRSGGQVRDEYRQEFDSGRGGWGHERLREEEERKKAEALEMQRRRAHEEVYQDQEAQAGGRVVPSGAEGLYLESEGDLRAGTTTQQAATSKRQRDSSEDEEQDASNKVRSTRSTINSLVMFTNLCTHFPLPSESALSRRSRGG
jgi:nuclear cap-binding protein subunit 2